MEGEGEGCKTAARKISTGHKHSSVPKAESQQAAKYHSIPTLCLRSSTLSFRKLLGYIAMRAAGAEAESGGPGPDSPELVATLLAQL